MRNQRLVIADPPGAEPARKNNTPIKDLRKEAAAWILDNPDAYALFVQFALQLLKLNRKCGISLITERVRWEAVIATNSTDGYRINNNHRPYIARQLIADFPDLARVFQFRQTDY